MAFANDYQSYNVTTQQFVDISVNQIQDKATLLTSMYTIIIENNKTDDLYNYIVNTILLSAGYTTY
jgi:hypothetical protein